MRVSVRTLKLVGPFNVVAIYSPTKRADNIRARNYIRARMNSSVRLTPIFRTWHFKFEIILYDVTYRARESFKSSKNNVCILMLNCTEKKIFLDLINFIVSK